MTEVIKIKRAHERQNPDLMQDILDPAVMEARREARRLEARQKEMDLLRRENRQKWAEAQAKADARREARERKRRREDIIEAVCLSATALAACICMVVLAITGGL